jgi:hypothetical protein
MAFIQAKIDTMVFKKGMKKGVEIYCKEIKTIIEEKIKEETLTQSDFLALVDSSRELFTKLCEEYITGNLSEDSMFKNKVRQAIENIKPNGDPNIQMIVTSSDIMTESVLPILHDMIEETPYKYNIAYGKPACVHCNSFVGEEHKEQCIYERLVNIARFFHK